MGRREGVTRCGVGCVEGASISQSGASHEKHSACPGSVREQPGAGKVDLRDEDVDMCAAKDDSQDKEHHTAVGATTEQSYF